MTDENDIICEASIHQFPTKRTEPRTGEFWTWLKEIAPDALVFEGPEDYAFDSAHRNGTARFDVPVTGSRASARLKYAWVPPDRVNTVKRAMLVLDDDKITLKKCGGKKKAAHKAKRAKRRMKANRRFRTKFSKRKKRR